MDTPETGPGIVEWTNALHVRLRHILASVGAIAKAISADKPVLAMQATRALHRQLLQLCEEAERWDQPYPAVILRVLEDLRADLVLAALESGEIAPPPIDPLATLGDLSKRLNARENGTVRR